VDKIHSGSNGAVRKGRSKSTELSVRDRAKDNGGVALATIPSESQSRSAKNPSSARKKETGGVTHPFIPVQARLSLEASARNGKPLMPCHPARARRLMRNGRAVMRYHKGCFFIRLLDREDGTVQDICLGIDPGSKREGFTVKSKSHTYINHLADAVTWVKDTMEVRRNQRRTRRYRKTPCRKCRYNRKRRSGWIPPSTKSRWGWKLRVSKIIKVLYPIHSFMVENIAARSKPRKRRWNASFSPLETGKKWFYGELSKLAPIETKQGYEVAAERKRLELVKTSSKLEDTFSAHNIDSWVLANMKVGGHTKPDNINITRIIPLQFHRRQLHYMQPKKGGLRTHYGTTKTGKFTRGMLIKHKKHGICYVGGYSEKTGISLHQISSGKRLTQYAKEKDIHILCFNNQRIFNTKGCNPSNE
jgi:hypothetical protein